MTSSSFSFSPELRKILVRLIPRKDLFALPWVKAEIMKRVIWGQKNMAKLSNQPRLHAGLIWQSGEFATFTRQSSGFGWRTESILHRSSR
jgi:hypothetical protein